MTVSEADDPAPSRPFHTAEPRGNLATFLRSPGVKFIMIGIISVTLLVPLLLVWGLTEERAQRAPDVAIDEHRRARRIDDQLPRPRERVDAGVLDEEAEVVVDEAVRQRREVGERREQRDAPGDQARASAGDSRRFSERSSSRWQFHQHRRQTSSRSAGEGSGGRPFRSRSGWGRSGCPPR